MSHYHIQFVNQILLHQLLCRRMKVHGNGFELLVIADAFGASVLAL